ncbi:MAG: hypothetical protein WD205_05830 [Rhodothermales bacterium]
MTEWNLDLFTSAVDDFERAQYRILGNLQEAKRDFSNNRIYPHLGNLVSIHGTLRTILENTDNLKDAAPGIITDVDLESGQVIYEKPELAGDQMAAVEELIDWALPQIEEAIDEGKTIFEFVEDHLRMEEVGIVPSYVQEGYLFVPDYERGEIHVLRYSMSIFTGASERFRSLRTSHVKSVMQKPVHETPQTLKLSLMEERRDLPNPATYAFDFELDFPYEPTVLPVAKRKLMRYLFAGEGMA